MSEQKALNLEPIKTHLPPLGFWSTPHERTLHKLIAEIERLRSLSAPAAPPRLTGNELKDLARQWVIQNKTSDSRGLHDAEFVIHAEGAISWMWEFALYMQNRAAPESGADQPKEPL